MTLWLLILIAATSNERSIMGELEHIDRTLAKAETRLAEIAAEHGGAEKELAHLEAELASTRLRKGEALEQFRRRVRALARMPAGARLALLGGSRSLSDYLETTRVLRWVATHDRDLHQHYITEANKLQNLETAMRRRRDRLQTLEDEQRTARDLLAAQRQQRFALAESIINRHDIAARVAVEKTKAGRELAQLVRKLNPAGTQSGNFANNKRRFPWPAAGLVDVGFGQVVDHGSGSTTTHNGLDIRAAAGAQVQAIAKGRVVFADWLRGYGRVVIIDHGNKYHTLCAHLAEITVATGDVVETSTPIGTVGDTGSLRGTVLYFEIRHGGTPINPSEWLR
ncbi:MAG: hypothetical protein A2289_19945 [Deltaproteobacteria bacterium RIFOXYA12_FULL_58_15]|nr:MAG: hypothetical protein A2289_19945 [Deltaproteobacteria bacterium RIFOXYA12_FULL_58_15]OGR08882.1 MAG: hypothetical protein A2341_27530 [Deltaproteobacteria bacterium RIFOXYB12_FULL_58_9]